MAKSILSIVLAVVIAWGESFYYVELDSSRVWKCDLTIGGKTVACRETKQSVADNLRFEGLRG